MKNKKITHLIQALDNGGCENMLLRTLPLLSDFEHRIITLNHQGELANKFERENISVININQKNLLDIFSYFRLLKEIKKEKPDIIFTYLFHADFVGRLFLQASFACHSRVGGNSVSIIPFLRTTYNHKKYWLVRLAEKLTKYFTTQYLANSESVKKFYVKEIGVAKEKITVIPNGIDVDFYDNIKRDENLRESLGIKKEDLAIICVANLHINKGHKYLLEAFEETFCHSREDGNPASYLLLVGDGEEKENLLKQVENYTSKNNILFLGKREDVPKLLKISDIFVLPTLFEGMSNAIMETMASGLPVITTDIPENRELIENGKSGLLISSENSFSLKKAIEKLIFDKNLKEKLIDESRKSMIKKFSLNKISKKINIFLSNNLNL